MVWPLTVRGALATMTWGVAITDEKGEGERYVGGGHTRCRGRVALVPRPCV